jgi:uncharacterized protein involved in exopolysaccharide biosynthesis
VPEAGLEYTRRLREVKYREALYELLAKQYEIARIDEAKESPLIQIVDRAVSPDKKSAPLRSIYVVIGVLTGAIAGVFSVLWIHSLKDPRQSKKFGSLKEALLR